MSGSATVTVASDFNSRPSARGNSDGGGLRIPHQNFNSRPSARGDRRKGYEELFRFISIHAPPRGATRRTHNAGSPRLFQFTPLREGRRNSRKSRLMGRYFNSRPSARGDGVVKDGRIHQRDFNSRPSARGDGLPGVYPPGMTRISIHAPPRGATGGYAVGATLMTISIHAPPRGATGSIYKNRIAVGYFNSRPSARGDLNPPPPRAAVPVFQFTPLREGRLVASMRYIM